jgi:tol-pal system protein YbgF
VKHLPTLTTTLVVLSLFGSPFDSRGAGQKKEDLILAELRNIQAQIAQLQASQAALKDTVDGLASKGGAEDDASRKTLADTKLALEGMQRDLSVLSERVDETNGRIGNLRQELLAMRQTQQPLVLPPAPGEEGEEPVTETADEAPAEEVAEPVGVVAAAPSVTDIYNQARIDYTQGRYPLAISGFKDVLELDRNGDLADNAHYWMGESYIAQRQYDQALAEFDTIIRDYPESNKRPDAYLKKAMTLELMDQRSEAMLMYELVIEQFPRSPQERVARRKLEDILRTTPPRPQL